MSRVVAYVRVSTKEQGDSGAGLQAQRSAILAAAKARGWKQRDIDWVEEVASGGARRKRPGLEGALDMLKRGDASILVASKVDRLSRSLIDFLGIMQVAQKQGWGLIVLDAPVDPSTAAGETMLSILALFAQLEKRLIGERTREALAERRAAGVKLGRPRQLPEDVRARIHAEHKAGETLAAIARALNDEEVPTAQGGVKWWPATVGTILRS